VDALLALAIGAAVVLLIASLTPIMEVHLRGLHSAASLPAAVRATWRLDEHLVAFTAAATAMVAPALLIALRLAVLLPMALGRPPRHLAWCMRVLHEMSRWSMVEVLMVAATVSIVRIAAMAQASPGPGMFAFGALALLIAALESGGMKHLWAAAE
jgi:paraquat-inducible protein A